jgi:hypothetical protein
MHDTFPTGTVQDTTICRPLSSNKFKFIQDLTINFDLQYLQNNVTYTIPKRSYLYAKHLPVCIDMIMVIVINIVGSLRAGRSGDRIEFG